MSAKESIDSNNMIPKGIELSFNTEVLFRLTTNGLRVLEEYCNRIHSRKPEELFEIDGNGFVKMPLYQVVAIFSENITTMVAQNTAIKEFKIIIPAEQKDSSQEIKFVGGRDMVMEILEKGGEQEHYQTT